MKKKDWLLGICSFLLPVFCMIYILYAGDFYPFGEKSLLIMDMRDEYIGYFASLKDALFGDNSLFYSWSVSLGGNYVGLLEFYIASPLSFITLFFSVEKLPLAIVILTVLKIGLCGLTLFIYANGLAKKANAELSFWILLPVVCYALMSYNMVYSLCLMWIDGVIMLPLVLLGIEKILEGKKGLLYMLSLALLFLSNYYTGYMVGIFTALYYIYRVCCMVSKENWKNYLRYTGVFAATTLLATALSAPFLFPALLNLLQGKLSGEHINYRPDTNINYEFSKLFGKYTIGNYDSITNAGLPAIYCGYLILLLAVLFLVLRGIKLREKTGAVLFLLLFAVSFCYIPIDMVWHGFQYPNWFPYRYEFLFGFMLIYMAVRAMCEMARWEKPKVPYLLVGLCVAMVVIGVLEMTNNGRKLLAGLDNEFQYKQMSEYTDFIQKTKPLVDEIKTSDPDFYRINQGYEFSKNDAMLLGYNGMTHYSSYFNASVNNLTRELGISQGYFWNSGYFATPLLNDLFSVKYILADKTVEESYQKIDETKFGTAVYQNDNALSIVYGADGLGEPALLEEDNPFTNQSNFLNGITGEQKSYFTDVPYTVEENEDGWTYSITTVSDDPLYLYMRAYNAYWGNVFVNDKFVGNYFSNETNGAMFLGDYPADTDLKIQVVPSGTDMVSLQQTQIAQMDSDMVAETMGQLQQNGLQVTKHNNGTIEGTITLEENQRIMTSIPYDEGWTIRIDGKKTEMKKYADTFMTFDCDAGEHTISLVYTSPGFVSGVIAAIVSLIISLLYFLWNRMPWIKAQASGKELAADSVIKQDKNRKKPVQAQHKKTGKPGQKGNAGKTVQAQQKKTGKSK